jgi:hydrogenase maturation factor
VDLASIRRLVIVAMLSDDVLFGKLVLKGGNAISLVSRYGARGSLTVYIPLTRMRSRRPPGSHVCSGDCRGKTIAIKVGIYTYFDL